METWLLQPVIDFKPSQRQSWTWGRSRAARNGFKQDFLVQTLETERRQMVDSLCLASFRLRVARILPSMSPSSCPPWRWVEAIVIQRHSIHQKACHCAVVSRIHLLCVSTSFQRLSFSNNSMDWNSICCWRSLDAKANVKVKISSPCIPAVKISLTLEISGTEMHSINCGRWDGSSHITAVPTYGFHQRLVFWNSIHQEVASDSFCFLILMH